jgi:hypothetical protein
MRISDCGLKNKMLVLLNPFANPKSAFRNPQSLRSFRPQTVAAATSKGPTSHPSGPGVRALDVLTDAAKKMTITVRLSRSTGHEG